MKALPQNAIVVEVKGGTVISAWSASDKDVKLIVVDHDHIQQGTPNPLDDFIVGTQHKLL